MRKIYLALVAVFMTAFAFSQGTITGTVLDGDSGSPLPGASVVVAGTTNGTATDFDGNFTLDVPQSSGVLKVTYIGYVGQDVSFTSAGNVGEITLNPDTQQLEGVVVISSVAVDRKTPVAVSTIKATDIALKLSTQEFPEILKSTPGVYATRAGGGYGDGRVNLRGFSSENVAVMINGVPVNDMENGAVYWSNWAGLGDVTSSMQVQRGLGASKVAVPSVGGTINIITKSTDVEQGGNIFAGIGNDGYQKYSFTYSTGLSDKGFAATVSASKIFGDGYVDGTEFSGYNYFVSLAQQINEHHKLSFTAFGAQQEHGQRYNRRTISDYLATESGPKRFNPDWGYKNGEVYHQSYNFYHKPQMSLNHFWQINDNSVLSTALYASFGNGGGRRDAGSKIGSDDYRLGGVDQPIDFDKIVQENIANGAAGSSDIISASRNSHQWYGLLSTYKNNISDKVVVSGGVDFRYYKGSHWYEVTDLLGGQFYLDSESDTYAYGKPLKVGDRYNKDYDGIVLRGGLFGQVEYQATDDLNFFVAADVSDTNYGKKEFMNSDIPANDRDSDKVDFLGYGVKGGGNYNLDDNNNVFVNVGYFSKAPFLTNVFLNEDTNDVNEDAKNEKVFSAEIGYGFRSSDFSANLNVYRTSWMDKALAGSRPGSTPSDIVFYNVQGLDALHQGVEVDMSYNASERLKLTGMVSLGNWEWKSDVNADVRDEQGNLVTTVDVFAKDTKVGNSAQTTFALGAQYNVDVNTKLYVDYNYAGDMYADYYVDSRSTAGLAQTWKAPAYGLFDVGLNHSFDFGPFRADLNGKINNMFNTEYISDAQDNNFDGTPDKVLVYYGAGRTYSVGLKLNF